MLCSAHAYTLCACGVAYILPYTRTYVDMTCHASALACRQEDESPYLPSEKAKSNTAAANYKVVSELERHTVATTLINGCQCCMHHQNVNYFGRQHFWVYSTPEQSTLLCQHFWRQDTGW